MNWAQSSTPQLFSSAASSLTNAIEWMNYCSAMSVCVVDLDFDMNFEHRHHSFEEYLVRNLINRDNGFILCIDNMHQDGKDFWNWKSSLVNDRQNRKNDSTNISIMETTNWEWITASFAGVEQPLKMQLQRSRWVVLSLRNYSHVNVTFSSAFRFDTMAKKRICPSAVDECFISAEIDELSSDTETWSRTLFRSCTVTLGQLIFSR